MLRRRPIARAALGTAVVAGTASAVSGRVARRQQARYEQQAAEDQSRYEMTRSDEAPQASAPAKPSQSDLIEQLNQLAALKDRGVLTESEFDEQKRKVLSAM
jgi:Short C-terminal domain